MLSHKFAIRRFSAPLRVCAMILIAVSFLPSRAARAGSNLRHLLDSNVPSTKFDNVPLSDCIDFLHDVSGANIVVDWKTLNAAGVARDAAVNLRLKNTSLEQVLNLILAQTSSGDAALTFYIDRDIIQVTTKPEADKHVYTVVYDVRDLLVTVPNFQVASNAGAAGSGGGYSGGGYGSGYGNGYGGASYGSNGYGPGAGANGANGAMGLGTSGPGGAANGNSFGSGPMNGFGQGAMGNSNGAGPAATGNMNNNLSLGGITQSSSASGSSANSGGSNSTDAQAQSLIKLIEAVVQPPAWKDNGGSTAFISTWNGTIIVTAPRPIQEAIGGPID